MYKVALVALYFFLQTFALIFWNHLGVIFAKRDNFVHLHLRFNLKVKEL